MAIAGLWREGRGNQPPSFAMLTTEPGPEVQPYHDAPGGMVVLILFLTNPDRRCSRLQTHL